MLPLLPLPDALKIAACVALLALAALLLHRRAPYRRALACVLAAALGLVGLGLGAWAWGSPPGPAQGVRLAWSGLVVLAPFSAALAITGVPVALLGRPGRAAPVARASKPDRRAFSRRTLLHGAAIALPAGAAGAGALGLARTRAPQRLPVVRMPYPDLHPDLHGLVILHLSDLHLGVEMRSEDLEALLLRAAGAFDLVVVTGDVADDLGELEKAIAILRRHSPRLGVFASLGNHEYFAGIGRVREIFEQGGVPLLVGEGVALEVGGARLFVAGADDPVHEGDAGEFLERTVDRAARDAPADAFRLLLSHRPEGFVPASRRGFHLTLSGHTHGGQIGLMGRSAFESLLPHRFLWGPYRRGTSRLYTTSGFGHWFPFRLGCPTEAPLVVLEKAGKGGRGGGHGA